jgi:PAS domain S-box-containing protein
VYYRDPIVIALDPEGAIVLFNDVEGRITGLKAEEVIGKNWFETFIPSIDREEIENFLREMWKDEASSFCCENPIRLQDGTQMLFRWFNMRLMDSRIDPLNPMGRPLAIAAIGYDISDLDMVEEPELATMEE